MKLIIGLGNPGSRYERTWHNAGFMALDALAKQLGAPRFREQKKFSAEIVEAPTAAGKGLLIKPQTFMNNSGRAVQVLLRFYRCSPADLWVLHDEIDLPLGAIKLSLGASAAGHRGVQSIIDAIGSQQFARVRIGIQPLRKSTTTTETYVLQKVGLAGTVKLRRAVRAAVAAVEVGLTDGISAAMNRFN